MSDIRKEIDEAAEAKLAEADKPAKKSSGLTVRGALRLSGTILALSLILGELLRSWGAGRHFLYIFDDIWMGLLLLAGSVLFNRDTVHRRALLAAGWGTCAGMLYGSFVTKLVEPASVVGGNFNAALLTLLIGIAFGASLIGLAVTLVLPKGK